MPSEVFSFELNGRETEVMARPLATLGFVLREQLQLRAAKAGCRQGGCGSCTVLVDGEPVLSCLLPVANAARRAGAAGGGVGAEGPLELIFHERFAVQCGFCAPGMLMAARAFLERTPSPSREE